MQAHKIPIFRSWVSEWMARLMIFAILMTSLFGFSFFSSPVATMGFYGVQPTDVQFAMVVIYGSTVAFLALDIRLVKYFAPRKYLLLALVVNMLCSVLCFYVKDWTLFVCCQFVQGVTCALMSGIFLQLTFPRLQSTRARIIAYSLLYGGIQISVPFYAIYSSIILHFYDFNWQFYGHIVVLIILTFLVFLTMNGKARFTKMIPLYQVDWTGYLFYISFILILGYILIYGRQLGWFDSVSIVLLSLSNLCLLTLFVVRSSKIKRPLINVQIFRKKNFIIGLFLLFTFYIFKGSTGLAYSYVEVILGNDPLSIIPIWVALISGTVLSMFVTSRFVLMGVSLTRTIVVGFLIMAFYYAYMILFISVQGETIDFILPLFIYGIATGALFVPIVTFTSSSVPSNIALNSSLVGILARFMGFTASMALNNEIQLFSKSAAREKVRETFMETNEQIPMTLSNIQDLYILGGNDIFTAQRFSRSHLNTIVNQQILARATRDYYDLMLMMVVCVILLLIICPKIQSTIIRLTRRNIPY